ncbi:hypothetical protein CAEBREN_19201 [Caenorhabditis brenneri]|uniref:DUF38 domain-containing protein n=1 Tax=Caenorhabditis brenneri TaxID=135651 RepID=G0NBG7_CAEBE|nr:hypothetical protein CAEBREN_19201 [Caenorhabditis brenneri]
MTQPFFFEELVLKIEKDKCYIDMGDHTCLTRVTYIKDGNGCIKASVRNGKQLIEGVSHWKQAAIDVNKTLQLPNLRINRLHICLVLDDPTAFHMATLDIGLEPFDAIINGVRARTNGNHLLQVERLIVDMYYLDHLQEILSSLAPESHLHMEHDELIGMNMCRNGFLSDVRMSGIWEFNNAEEEEFDVFIFNCK